MKGLSRLVLVSVLAAALPGGAARAQSPGEIRGTDWIDEDGDGVRDAGEAGLAGATVYVDANYNGWPDPGEASTVTNPDGSYSLTGLPLEELVVSTSPAAGFAPTYPTAFGLSPVGHFPAQQGPRLPTAADLDGDGRPDLVVTNVFSNSVSILRNVGDGTFVATSIAVGQAPRDVLATDLDADGDLDLAVTNMNSATVSVLINGGGGAFADPVSYRAGAGAWIVKAADLDGDGDADLAVANQVAGSVSLLANRGDGSFVFAGSPRVGTWPHSLEVRDLDGDGDLDLVTANLVSNDVSFLLNRGNGTFTPALRIPVGSGPLETTFADVDGNGEPDLVVENLLGGDVSVLTGEGGGAFAAPVHYPTGAATHDVDAVDLDGDGDLDLVASAFTANTLSVLVNRGDGTFDPAVSYPTGTGSLFIEARDFDLDGDTDCVVNNIDSDDVSLLLNNGDGTFAPALRVPIGDEPRFMTTADLNDDGRPDIVSANLQGNDVSVVYGIVGEHVVSLSGAAPVTGVDFGSRPLGSAKDVAAGRDHSFKLRIGEGSHKSVRLKTGSGPVTVPIVIRRFRGEGAVEVDLTWGVVEGDPSRWRIHASQRSLTLGAPLTNSTGDVDDPGVRENELGDGDVDQDDLAAFASCFTGPDVPLATGALRRCIGFDFDGDLDVDAGDQGSLLAQVTGPVLVPWNQRLAFTVAAVAPTPIGETARIQLVATRRDTGESRSVFARVEQRPYAPSLSPILRFDITKEQDDKLIFGRTTSFELSLANLGASPDTVTVDVEPVSGFTFRVVDLLTGAPRSAFPLEGAPPIGPQFPASSRPIRVEVTAPVGWPRGSEATLQVVAESMSSSEKARLELHVAKAGALWSPSDLGLSAGRRHRVLAGRKASHGFLVTNPYAQERTLTLVARPVLTASGWTGMLSASSLTLGPGAQAKVTLLLGAPAGAAKDSTSDWVVSLLDGTKLLAVNRVGARVTNDPKVIFVAVDGLSPEYLQLDAAGTGVGSEDDWLMPNAHALMALGTTFTNVASGLPSYTDPNHVAALSGSAMGTSGVGNVIYYYYGRDQDGASVVRATSSESLRYGPGGDPVLTIFDVARQTDPGAFTGFFTGKNWMSSYLRRAGGGADMIVDSFDQPFYVGRPLAHVIGDPPSDPDAALDPPLDPALANWGNAPGLFPSDEFIMQAATSALDFEDPDILYILLAGTDDVGHMLGAAWDSDEWDDQGTSSTWDDRSLVNPLADRESILDEVREADVRIGGLLQNLAARGILDQTYLVLVSDHGMVSFSPHPAELDELLEQAGYSNKDDYEAWAGGAVAHFFGIAPENLAHFESVLEDAPPLIAGFPLNPWIVVNQQEMLTGVDARTGVKVGEPGELYSEFFVEHAPDTLDQPKWAQLLVLFEKGGQVQPLHYDPGLGEDEALEGDAFAGGHAGRDTQPIVLVLSGPGITAGQHSAVFARIVDVAPTLYELLGWPAPANVEGIRLPGIAP